jgi:hypothetical protein
VTREAESKEPLRITSPEGWCVCPCHQNDQVLHVARCCRECPQCGNPVPLGLDEHVCRRRPRSELPSNDPMSRLP